MKRSLKPFFVPFAKPEPKLMAKVSITVKWDSVSDRRFESEKNRIRNDLFKFLAGFVKTQKDLQERKAVLEEGLNMVMSNSMGLSGIDIVVEKMEAI